MDVLSWISLAVIVTALAAIPSLIALKGRMTAALEKERRALEDALAALAREKRGAEDRIRAARESARGEALEEFFRELRVQERSRLRESSSMFSSRRIVLREERLCFRDQPLSKWVEQQTVIDEGIEPGSVPKSPSVFLPLPQDNAAFPA
jgi:hypothetical protein